MPVRLSQARSLPATIEQVRSGKEVDVDCEQRTLTQGHFRGGVGLLELSALVVLWISCGDQLEPLAA